MERDTKFIKRISLSNNKLDKFLEIRKEKRKRRREFEWNVMSSKKLLFLNLLNIIPPLLQNIQIHLLSREIDQ